MMKVCKFGGSSVANAKQFSKVKQIVSDPSRKFIVVSACGKSDKNDHKVTDLLYLCHAHLQYGVSYEDLLCIVENKYVSIADELGIDVDLDEEFDMIRSSMKKGMNLDYLVSRGEYLCAKCMASYIGAKFVDAKDLIIFDYNGSINEEKTLKNIQQKCSGEDKYVIPGFYGSYPNGEIHLMSRGGSDITGSILADCVNADLYENWTDVSGIMIADPRIVDNPKSIPRITYNELREMSYMGANVLHEETIFPVKHKNIPINILNTNEPDNKGTLILENCDEMDKLDPPYTITGITGKKGFSVINIIKSHSSNEVGILKRALEIVAGYQLSIEAIPSGIDSFSIVLETEKTKHCIYELMADLKEQLNLDSISLQEGLALVAIVGRKMKDLKGISGKIFGQLGNNDINIRMISQGADEINITIGIESRDFDKTINCIYDKFIKEVA